jgi:hypothetical protein
MVGLSNVDNTTDLLKPVSSAAQTALDFKENASNKSTVTTLGTSDDLYPSQNAVKTYVDAQVAGATIADADIATKGKIQLAGDLAGTAALPTVPGLALKAPLASPTFTGTVGGIDKTMVGLSNVDNTNDANKPVSAAAQTALNLKADLASPTFTGTPTLPTGTVAITQAAANNTTAIATTAYADAAAAAVSSASTNSLALKADIASPTFTGTVAGIDKTMVGLANVDNTTDLLKPVSTATQTALDLKSNVESPSFTGIPLAPTAVLGNNTTQLATTSFVSAAVTAGTSLTSANIRVGNASNVATAVALSGDATITNAGVLTISMNTVNSAKIVNESILSEDILNGTIAEADLATSAVTSVKIANETILSEDILDGTIATVDVANNAITYAKMQAMSANRLLGSGLTGTAAAEMTLGNGLSFTGTTLNAVSNNIANVTVVSASVTLTAANNTVYSSGVMTLTLPAAAANAGLTYAIVKTDDTVLTFSAPITITSTESFTTLNYARSVRIQSNGTNWFMIN